VSNLLAAEVLSIPVYPELEDAQRAEVVAAIRAFLVRRAGRRGGGSP